MSEYKQTNEWDYNPNTDGVIAIPVRVSNEPTPPVTDDEDELVREYEAKYYGTPKQRQHFDGLPPRKSKEGYKQHFESMKRVKLPPQHRYSTRPAPAYVEDSERLWAMLAHASALISIIALFSSGPGVVFALLIPLGIYLIFRRRSEYVAYHALQAFTAQTLATIGAFTVLIAGSIVLTFLIVVSALFSIILIGIPFLIIFVLLFMALLAVTLSAPFVMLIYSMIAAHAAWSGRNYRYPYVADWVDDQLNNGMLRPQMV
ncbi:MAG: DUF4870 domain-containing protein [Anaerolineales bacterium]|nr:DUF4870 domain-containing protein [Anaerolineales bacterium]